MKDTRSDIFIRFGVFLYSGVGKMNPIKLFNSEKEAEDWGKSLLKSKLGYTSAIVIEVDFHRLRAVEKSILNIKVIHSPAIMKRGNVCPICKMTQDR